MVNGVRWELHIHRSYQHVSERDKLGVGANIRCKPVLPDDLILS